MKKGGRVAPQNTFLDSILRRSNELDLTFVIGNAAISYFPIIYSSGSFSKATDYPKSEVLHRSCTCDFLWGSLTSKETQKQIQGTIDAKTTMQTEVVLYKKNRQPCWFLFHISPIRNDEEDVILFLITFKDISSLKDPIADSTVTKWSRLVEKSLAKQKLDFNKTSDNARSVFLQLAKKDGNKKQKLAQIMSNTSMSIQYSWAGQKIPRFTVFHYSLFKTTWDWIILILTLYTAVVVPFVVSFRFSSHELVIFNLFVDSFFIADVVLNFKTTYCGKEGETVLDSKLICMNYLKSWFVVDFVAALPYGVLNLAYSDGNILIFVASSELLSFPTFYVRVTYLSLYVCINRCSLSGQLFSSLPAMWIEIINVIKVIRLVRLLRVARKLDHYLKFGAMTLVLWLFLFCLCCHWMACIWYVIAVHYDTPSKKWSWINILSELTDQQYQYENGTLIRGSGPTIASGYMSALYYCMSSLTTCGFGNIAPNTTAEKIFGCATMLLGCLLYAFIFGQVTSIIQQLQKPNSDFHQKLDSIKKFTRLYTVPEEIGGRLIDYFRTTWTTNKGLDVDEILSYFPNELQADACLQIHKIVFESMPEFKSAPFPALRMVSRFYSTVRSAPGAKVIQQGELVEYLYFVERGSMEIRRNEQIVGILGPGDVFGSHIRAPQGKSQKSLYELHTLTYSDLHYIKIEVLSNALQLFPEFYRNFKKKLVYSFEITKKMRVYASNGKRYDLFEEEETSFIEGKLDSDSLGTTQDQTMVEGQLSSDNLTRGKGNTRTSPTLHQNLTYESKMDIFTELNILREDVKSSIDDVYVKINTFDGKLNHVLDILQKIDSSQSRMRKEIDSGQMLKAPNDGIQTDENENTVTKNSNDDLPKRRISKQMNGKPVTESRIEIHDKIENVLITQESEVMNSISNTEEPGVKSKTSPNLKDNGSFKASEKDAGSRSKTFNDDGIVKDNLKESEFSKEDSRSSKKEAGPFTKEAGRSKKEKGAFKKEDRSNREKASNNKISPEKNASNGAAKPRPVMKQPKQRPVADDLDEIERELEEIGIPNEAYKQPKLQSSVRKVTNSRKLTSKT